MSCCSKLIDSLKKLVKKLLPLIAIGLVLFGGYLLLVAGPGVTLGSVLSGIPWMPAALAASTIPASTAAWLALGAAVIVSPETVGEIVGNVVSTAAEIAGSVVSAGLGGLVSGLTGGGSGSIVGYALLAGLVYFLFFSDQAERRRERKEAEEERLRLRQEEREDSLRLGVSS